MKKLVLFYVILYSTISYNQTTNNEFPANLPPQGYGNKLLNSSGASSIFNDVSNIGFMNPASIAEFDNYSFGISYQASTNIDEAWIADLGTSHVYNFYPQSAGGIVKWNDFTFGLGFGQKYNGTLDMDPIPVTTVQDPDGTGEFFDATQETMIHSYSLTAAYSFKELLQTSNDLSFGIRYSLNRFNRYDEIWHSIGHATDYSSSFTAGLCYQFDLEEKRKLSVGLAYENKTDFRAEYEIDQSPINYQWSDTTGGLIPAEISTSILVASLPDELRFDLAIDATQNLKFLINLTSVFWKNDQNYLQDQVEYSTSSFYNINEMLTTSLGFFYTDYNHEDNRYYRVNGKLSAFFITAGLKLNFKMFYADLAIADSHLFSGDFRKQTIGKLAFGVHL